MQAQASKSASSTRVGFLLSCGSFVLRAPSVVAGALTVPLLYLLVARLGGRLAAVYASLLFVVSESLVFWQQNARDYSLVVFFAVASTLAAVVAMEEGRLWRFAVWAVVTALGCYTHPELLLLLPPQEIVLLLWTRSARARISLLAVTALGALAGLPVLGEATHSSVYQITPLGPPNYGSATEIATFLASAAGTSQPVRAANHALLGITFAVVLLGVAMLGADLVERGCTAGNLGLGLCLAWLTVPPVLSWIVSESGRPDFLDRYLILSLPATAAVVALVAVRLDPRMLGLFIVVYLTIFRAGLLVQSYHWPLDDYRDATRTVLASAQRGDCITLTSNQGRTLWDYYSARITRIDGRNPYVPPQELPLARNGTPVVVLGFNDMPIGEINAFQADVYVRETTAICKRMWLFSSHSGSPNGPPALREEYQSMQALRTNLSHYYRPVKGYPFPGVGVFLYDRIRVAWPR